MIKFTLAIFSLIFLSWTYSQEFKPSASYQIVGLEYEKRVNMLENDFLEDTLIAYLVNSKDPSEQMKGYHIPNIDLYDSVYVKEWIKPGYKNVERILWVQFEYAACCYDYEVYYYIVTKKGELVDLPFIGYSMCDFPSEIEEYEYDPEGNMFRRVINFYTGKDKIEESTDVETLFWDGQTITGPE